MARAAAASKVCSFCEIVAQRVPAFEVLRTDDFVAFLDIRPLFAGHTLLVPTSHVATFDALPLELAHEWVELSQRLQRAVQSAMSSDGSLMLINNVVSQSVPHLHLHVIPRSRGDGLRFWLGPRHPYASEAAAERVAASIRAELGR
ncbi:MAG: HIT family protein [Protaetiibacter sp.]